MIGQVLDYINNFFVDTHEYDSYTIEVDGIRGNFTNVYLQGQYISLDGSISDGVYKILSVTSNKLTLEGVLIPQTAYCHIFGLAVPKGVIDLAEQIKQHNLTIVQGLTAESQGKRSVSYKNGSSWEDVYGKRLRVYKSVYNDKARYLSKEVGYV